MFVLKCPRTCQTSLLFRCLLLGLFFIVPGFIIGCKEDQKLTSQTQSSQLQSTTDVTTHETSSSSILGNTTSQGQVNQTEHLAVQQCNTLFDGPPQGLSCLHCTHPKARTQAEELSDILIQSCLKNIAINYLVDGSFGSFEDSEEFLFSQVKKLTRGGRHLFLYFYLSNGPWQRSSSNAIRSALSPLARISPKEFRKKILSDYATQIRYQLEVRKLLPLIRYAQSKGATVSLIPFLEDNLDRPSYEKLYDLTLDAVPTGLAFSIGRNACRGCFQGNDSYVPAGLFREIHTTSSSGVTTRSGVVSNDGKSYRFTTDNQGEELLPLRSLKKVRDKALQLDNTFVLWSGKFQGRGTSKHYKVRHPDDRHYPSPTEAEVQEIIDFLTSYPGYTD